MVKLMKRLMKKKRRGLAPAPEPPAPTKEEPLPPKSANLKEQKK